MTATVVLLHAMGASARMWRAPAAALSERYHVIVPDLPGHGTAGRRFTIGGAVAHVREQTANASSPVYLAGASLGATVALHLALRDQDRVAGLLLFGATVRVPAATAAAQRVVTTLLPLRLTARMSTRIVAPVDDADRATFEADIRRAGKRAQSDALRELTRDDLRPRLPTITAPTLVSCGSRDRANIASARLLTDRLPNAELLVVQDAGHLWTLQHPGLCTDTIHDFIERTRRTG